MFLDFERKRVSSDLRNRLRFTDCVFLVNILFVLLWAVDPFMWLFGQMPGVKHIPVFFLLLSVALIYVSSRIYPPQFSKPLHSELRALNLISLFSILVISGSLFARVFAGIDETFLTLGVCVFGAHLMLWATARSHAPFLLREKLVAILTAFAVVTALIQVASWGRAEVFHSREHLIIPPLVFGAVSSRYVGARVVYGVLAVASVLAANKFTGYLVLLSSGMFFVAIWLSDAWSRVEMRLSRSLMGVFIGLGFLLFFGVVLLAYLEFRNILPTGNTVYRLHTYELAFNRFLDSPLWGAMYSGSAVERFTLFTVASTTQNLPTHSDPLDILAGGGVLGATLFLFGVWVPLRASLSSILKERRSGAAGTRPVLWLVAATGLVVCCFNPILNFFNIALMFWICLGASLFPSESLHELRAA